MTHRPTSPRLATLAATPPRPGGSVPVLEVQGLRKVYRVHRRPPGLAAAMRSLFHRTYQEIAAVDGIDLSVDPGERVGFLGPNGAGKTTTLKILAGLLHPTAGEVRVAGHRPSRREPAFLRRITLVLGQKQQLLWDLPPAETFELNRAIYGIPREDYRRTLGELDELLDLRRVMQQPARQLSLGERMKCELAAALLHRPGVLFLDEPTIGLDVSLQAAIRQFLRAYNEQRGATVLLTSHSMDDVVALCPRIVVIDHGRIRYDGSPADLVRQVHPEKLLTLRFSGPVDRTALRSLGAIVLDRDDTATLRVPQPDLQRALAEAMRRLPVLDLFVEDPPLEEVLRDLFEGNAGAAESPPRASTEEAPHGLPPPGREP